MNRVSLSSLTVLVRPFLSGPLVIIKVLRWIFSRIAFQLPVPLLYLHSGVYSCISVGPLTCPCRIASCFYQNTTTNLQGSFGILPLPSNSCQLLTSRSYLQIDETVCTLSFRSILTRPNTIGPRTDQCKLYLMLPFILLTELSLFI